jgi:hypothetical protein
MIQIGIRSPVQRRSWTGRSEGVTVLSARCACRDAGGGGGTDWQVVGDAPAYLSLTSTRWIRRSRPALAPESVVSSRQGAAIVATAGVRFAEWMSWESPRLTTFRNHRPRAAAVVWEYLALAGAMR